MADADAPIMSAPNMPGQPYDATSDAPCGPWVKLPGGPCDGQGNLTGADFPSDGRWQQC